MVIFELGCGERENKIVIRNLRRQLNHVVLHEQVENGIAINNNLNVNQVDQLFETPRRVFRQNKDICGQKRDL